MTLYSYWQRDFAVEVAVVGPIAVGAVIVTVIVAVAEVVVVAGVVVLQQVVKVEYFKADCWQVFVVVFEVVERTDWQS